MLAALRRLRMLLWKCGIDFENVGSIWGTLCMSESRMWKHLKVILGILWCAERCNKKEEYVR